MKFGVLVFPGSNCDHDTYNVIEQIAHQPVAMLWHESEDLQGCDAILVPGGFAYGGLVLGICNGFQILCESGLLPGALMRNAGLKYICRQVHLRTETTNSPFTHTLKKGQVLQIPIGHMEGNYFCDASTLATLKRDDRIVFRYATPTGEVTPQANPNGSLDNIAGVLNEGRNVMGMMPHPDRSSEALLGSSDGFLIFQSMIEVLSGAASPAGNKR
jgi:phosphoribosylformylglycinamidine synthase